MSVSSLLGPMGKDYRQPKARNHGKLLLQVWLPKISEVISPWRHAHMQWTTSLPWCHKTNDIQVLMKNYIIIILLIWLPPPRSKLAGTSGIITNLFVSKSQLLFFKISHLSLLLLDVFTVVMMRGLEYNIWSHIGGCYLVWAQQEEMGVEKGRSFYIYTPKHKWWGREESR